MMTDKLILMLDKFKAGTGKAPTKIICGKAAFEKLCREATDDWGADRYLKPNINRDGYVATFVGIPIQVIHNPNMLEDDKIYMFNEPDDGYFKPAYETQWCVRGPCNDLIVDDLVPPKGFERRYLGKWKDADQDKTDLYGISDTDFMSVLNGIWQESTE